jgi:hypothetical protein
MLPVAARYFLLKLMFTTEREYSILTYAGKCAESQTELGFCTLLSLGTEGEQAVTLTLPPRSQS